jgi:hypothetical protein
MRKIISLLAGLVLSFSIQAQTNSIKHMDVYLQMVRVDTLLYHSPQMLIDLNDTTTISSIEVTLGTSEGGTDIITKSFVYNTEGQFDDGTAYIRDNNIIRLSLGLYQPMSSCYASARLRYSNNNYSAPITFSIQ